MCLIILMSKTYGNLRFPEESPLYFTQYNVVIEVRISDFATDCLGLSLTSAMTLNKSFTFFVFNCLICKRNNNSSYIIGWLWSK